MNVRALVTTMAVAGAALLAGTAGPGCTRTVLAAVWPDWAEHAPQPGDSFQTKAPAIDLFRETVVRFDGTDRYTETSRRVVRIRTHEGRSEAVAAAPYSTDGGSVKSLRAWLKTPSGTIRELDKSDAVDRIRWDGALYSEDRIRTLSAADEADAGSIFAWEAVVESRTPIAQFGIRFQDERPAVRSRFAVQVPDDWTPSARIWNHPPLQPSHDKGTWVWTTADLGPIEEEPWGLAADARVPGIGVTLVSQSTSGARLPSLTRWEDVSRWMAAMADPQAALTPALEARSRALTANLRSDEDRIRAVAQYTQAVNYMLIQMGIGRGHGYCPHPASDVLAKNYGDCKDKANLMKALLRAIGIESYLVLISGTDPALVRENWPSPWQFDHCILGVRAATDHPGCSIDVPPIGRITLFDPTDSNTPWGSLPETEQGALALVVSSAGGSLFRTPAGTPERNRVERVIEAELVSNGDLGGTVRATAFGASGTRERGASRGLTPTKYREAIGAWIHGGASEVTVSSVRAEDDSAGAFAVDAAFQAARFARPVAGFLPVRPVIASSMRGASWPETRQGPLRLNAFALHETGTIRFPAGYVADELPAPSVIDTPFASYRLDCRLSKGALTFERILRFPGTTLPPSEYPTVRRFYEQVRAAESAQVLLTRK